MIDKVAKNIPNMTHIDLIRVWKKTLEILSDPTKQSKHERAEFLRNGVENEWRDRGRRAPDSHFNWPTTEAHKGHGTLDTSNWNSSGLLSELGYKVGIEGESTPVRHAILDRVFLGALPPIISNEYMISWYAPRTSERLQKTAESIAAFARNAYRRTDQTMVHAIDDWEKDLKYLYEKFYDGYFSFSWPRSRR